MSQRNNDECQFAVNMFKSTESSLKSQLDLLQKAIDDRKSFRSLNLLISRAKTLQTELDKKTEAVLRAKPHQSTATSILDRQKALTSRLQQSELEVDTLDDDGLLSQSSTRFRDDVTIPSRPSSRRLDSERSTPTRNVIVEETFVEQAASSQPNDTTVFIIPPPIPPRPIKPSLFLNNQQIQDPLISHLINQQQNFHQQNKNQFVDSNSTHHASHYQPTASNTLEQPNANHQQETLTLPPLNMSNLDHQLNQEPNFLTAKDLEFSGSQSNQKQFVNRFSLSLTPESQRGFRNVNVPCLPLQDEGGNPFLGRAIIDKPLNHGPEYVTIDQNPHSSKQNYVQPMHYCFTNNLQPTTAANVVSDVQSYCFSKEQDVQLKPQKPENSFVQRVSSFNIGPNNPVKNTTLTNSFPIQGLAVQRPPVYPYTTPAQANIQPVQSDLQLLTTHPTTSQEANKPVHGFNPATQTSMVDIGQNNTNAYLSYPLPIKNMAAEPAVNQSHSNDEISQLRPPPLPNLYPTNILPTSSVRQHQAPVFATAGQFIPSMTNSELQPTSVDLKCSIKLPPLKLQNFNGNPMHYHEWINNFFSMVHNNISITDTHRITYLQNSVSGKAKDLIHAYSCDPSYYNTALNEIMCRFGDPSVVVNAFINQLESWKCNSSYNKQSFIAFSSFLKRLVQAFQNLGFQADLQSSTLLRKAKEKIPHNLLLKWTEYTLTENVTTTTLVEFQKWLDVQARVYDKVNQENRTSTFTHNKNGNYPAVTAQQSVQEQFKQTTARQSQRNDLDQGKVNHNGPKNEQQFANKHTNCVQCHKPHFVATCSDYHKLSPEGRFQTIQKNSLCTNCLSNQHRRDTCPSSKRCQVCNGFHHTTLHNPAKQFNRTHAAFTTSNVQQQTKTSGQQNWS